jgi:hypothetical protein
VKRVIETVLAYREFQSVELELSVFVDRWLTSLEADELFVGSNWSAERATGYDLTPSDVRARFETADLHVQPSEHTA